MFSTPDLSEILYPPQPNAKMCCCPTATTCPTLRPCSPTSSATRPAKRPRRAPNTSCWAWWSLCSGGSATLKSACWAAPCWRRAASGRRCWSPVAPPARPCARSAATPSTGSRWPGPTSWTVIASLSVRRRDVTTRWRASKVRKRRTVSGILSWVTWNDHI